MHTHCARFACRRRPTSNTPKLRDTQIRGGQHRPKSSTSGPAPVPEKNAPSRPSHDGSVPPDQASRTSEVAVSAAGASAGLLATPSRSVRFRQLVGNSPIGRLGKSYARVQERRPYTTQVCSSIVVYLCGDLTAQLLFPSESAKEGTAHNINAASGHAEEALGTDDVGGDSRGYDPWRTLRHLTVGVVSSIPSYKWFMFLHHHFNYSSKFLSILTKVSVQQIVFTPIFNTYFFSMQSLLAGASLAETWERLKMAVPVSITNSVKLWPAITAFSFMYVPPQFRSVFAGCVAVGWQTYLSWLNQKAAREVHAAIPILAPSSTSSQELAQGGRSVLPS